MSTLPWSESLELWWQTLAPSIPPDNHAIFQKFIAQGQSYFRFTEQLLQISQNLSSHSEVTLTDWEQLWEKTIANLKNSFTDIFQQDKKGRGCFWEMPLDNWQQTVSSLSMRSSGPEKINQEFERLLSLPGIGYTQKWQCHLQERTRLWMNYQKALDEYVSVFRKIGMRTIDLFQNKILALSIQGRTLDSLRAVYDLWVDCGEEAYANVVSRQDFGEVNAQLINAFMTWKQHESTLLDELLNFLNIPTRPEFDTITLRMQQMRREFRTRQSADASTLDNLRKEVETLHTELKTLKETPKPTTTRAKRTTAKSKASAIQPDPSQPQTATIGK